MSEVSTDTAGHIERILDLLRVCFPAETKYSKEYLEWLYLKNPLGVTVSANMVSDGQVKATYAVLPMVLHCHDPSIRVALSLNTATHPDARGQGWFPKLANMVYENAAKLGISAIVGVANENSFKGFIKHLGFDGLGNIALRLSTPRKHLQQLRAVDAGSGWSREYWMWRTANPSATYSRIESDGEWLLVAKRKIPVLIGRLGDFEPNLPVDRLLGASPVLPAYVYGLQGYGIDIPRKVLPSPWHLIIKNLNMAEGEFADFKEHLVFTGLDSDTF